VERDETKSIVKLIKESYGNKFSMNDPKATIDAWHLILRDYDFDLILENLKNYITNNSFAPTIADLVKPPKVEAERYIPSVEETKLILDKQEAAIQAALNDPKTKDAKERAKAEIRKILGIGG
jgi:hypothetical protein